MNHLFVLVGRYSTGKSTYLANVAKDLAKGGKEKVLILDPGEAPAYAEFPTMPADKAWRFTNPKKQGAIWRIEDTGDRARELSLVFGWRPDPEGKGPGVVRKGLSYLNGTLILEDSGAYLDSNLSRRIKSELKAMKQHGLNLFLSYHSLSEISAEVIRMSPTYLAIKKTSDDAIFGNIKSMSKLPNYNQIMRAYYLVKFKGLGWKDIIEDLPDRAYSVILNDLRIDMKIGNRPNAKQRENAAKALAKFANGKITVTAKQKLDGQYHTELVQLR